MYASANQNKFRKIVQAINIKRNIQITWEVAGRVVLHSAAFLPNNRLFFLQPGLPSCWHTVPFVRVSCQEYFHFRYPCVSKERN